MAEFLKQSSILATCSHLMKEKVEEATLYSDYVPLKCVSSVSTHRDR